MRLPLAGILRDKTMEDKLIEIPNDDKQYYPFCRLILLVKMFGIFHKNVSKVFKPTNKITLIQNFGYQCNLQSIFI